MVPGKARPAGETVAPGRGQTGRRDRHRRRGRRQRRVLRAHGWSPVAVEYGSEGAEVARERGCSPCKRMPVISPSARARPVSWSPTTSSNTSRRTTSPHRRSPASWNPLVPRSSLFRVTCGCGPRMMSRSGTCAGTRGESLRLLMEKGRPAHRGAVELECAAPPGGGLPAHEGVGQRPATAQSCGQRGADRHHRDERYLPVKSWPGVSLVLRAVRRD